MQIPILNGVYTGEDADYKTSYPVNMMPVIQSTGVSEAYLRPVNGITETGSGPGISRGAINWNNVHYRVMGSKLCSIDENGIVTEIGDVGNDGKQVTLDYSFDRLAIASNENLFYYDGTTLSQVTDVDLGTVIDMLWVDGYFMTTDGEFLVVTELADPTAVNPLKYGSSEIDPDPINGLLKLRNEIYAVNRYSIEVFDNIGGDNFPFQRVDGAQLERGALGTFCSTVYEETIAFLGSGRNESPGVYLAVGGQTSKISTREIDEILSEFTEEELSRSILETMNEKSHKLLWIRIPNRTLVYDQTSSVASGEQVWYIMSSSKVGYAPYRAKDVIWCYDAWQVGDAISAKIGILNEENAFHFGDTVRWEFGTKIIYNESRGAIFSRLELVALTGRIYSENDPQISTSYSVDGRVWSNPKLISVGALGERLKRLVWRRQGIMKSTRVQRFSGDSNSYIAVSRLEAMLEPLGV